MPKKNHERRKTRDTTSENKPRAYIISREGRKREQMRASTQKNKKKRNDILYPKKNKKKAAHETSRARACFAYMGVENAELPVDIVENLDPEPDLENPNDDPTSRPEDSGRARGRGPRGEIPVCTAAEFCGQVRVQQWFVVSVCVGGGGVGRGSSEKSVCREGGRTDSGRFLLERSVPLLLLLGGVRRERRTERHAPS